ncbi:hypothetical protein LTR37_008476 [Vermiconidia calcicola]|uniref:Uncharacterized protein n=1 Tax=Vermiconidia calcicola TaxID=1690605 RepID=A0ACC3NC82_9PEZI|nr:hypothetical protein LTR37_008476 [Vermiconidia calcicola]
MPPKKAKKAAAPSAALTGPAGAVGKRTTRAAAASTTNAPTAAPATKAKKGRPPGKVGAKNKSTAKGGGPASKKKKSVASAPPAEDDEDEDGKEAVAARKVAPKTKKRKPGPTREEGDEEADKDEEASPPKKQRGRPRKQANTDEDEDKSPPPPKKVAPKPKGSKEQGRKRQPSPPAEDLDGEDEDEEVVRKSKKGPSKPAGPLKAAPKKAAGKAAPKVAPTEAADPLAALNKPLETDVPSDQIKTNVEIAARRQYAEAHPPTWPPPGVAWAGKRYLGGGAMGQAYLYYEVDENLAISRRIVVKDCYVPLKHWGSVQHWSGDPRDPKGRVHMEIKAMEALKGRTGSDKVVEIEHSEVNDERLYYRIYMEFCGRGSLNDLLGENYMREEKRAKAGRKAKKTVAAEKDAAAPSVPEPAVWAIFDALVDATCLMAFGDSQSDGRITAQEGTDSNTWRSIVHRDLKTENIYLADPDPEWFPQYPVAKIGDFGIAIMTDEGDVMNPHAYNDEEGTQSWMPPEMIPFVDGVTKDIKPVGRLLDWTNVWGIGAIILRVMNGHPESIVNPGPGKGVAKGPTYKDGTGEPQLVADAREHYSEQLCRLVEQCVRFTPSDRIGVRELRRQLREHVNDADLTQGQQVLEADEEVDEALVLASNGDRYKVGMTPAV